MYIYICIYVYIYIHTYIHTYIHIYIYIYIYIRTHARTHARTHTHSHTHTQTRAGSPSIVALRTRAHTYTQITYTHARTHAPLLGVFLFAILFAMVVYEVTASALFPFHLSIEVPFTRGRLAACLLDLLHLVHSYHAYVCILVMYMSVY